MYDVIVVGIGGIGSAAFYHLARSGAKVLGLDQFPPGHDKGSSHGESRMIRKSYFEHPGYVPLAKRAWVMWQELQSVAQQQLLHPSGVVYYGKDDGIVLNGVRESAKQHEISVEELTARETKIRFPQFASPDNTVALFESDAGILLVEECIRTHASLAESCGGVLQAGETVKSWTSRNGLVTVTTSHGTYQSRSLIISSGAWTNSLLSTLNIPLRVIRKHLHWYSTSDARLQMSERCPAYFVEHQSGYFYGLPQMLSSGIKVGEHSGGSPVDDPLCDPRHPEENDTQRVARFVDEFLPESNAAFQTQKTCFYTMTPDEHFIVDHHPDYKNVVIAAGFSGHGFKFAPVLGQTLAKMACGERPDPDFDLKFLRLSRLGSL